MAIIRLACPYSIIKIDPNCWDWDSSAVGPTESKQLKIAVRHLSAFALLVANAFGHVP